MPPWVQIGNDAVASVSRPGDASALDQMVWDAWQGASTMERQRLAELFIRTVGHREFWMRTTKPGPDPTTPRHPDAN